MQNYIVESVDKALDLLMEVARKPNIGVTDLARKTGLNKSRAPGGTFAMPSLKIASIASD